MRSTPGWLRVLLFVLLGVLAVGILFVIPNETRVVAPHAPVPVVERMSINGKPASRVNGRIDLVGVDVLSNLSYGEKLIYQLFYPDVSLEQPLPGEQVDPNRTRDRQLIQTSKEIAAAVTYRLLGRPVEVKGSGAIIQNVDPNGPAHNLLQVGDSVVTAGKYRIQTAADLTVVVGRLPPRSPLRLGVRRSGLPRVVKLKTRVSPHDPGKSWIGVEVATPRLRIQLPDKINFRTGVIGGPSAGLAFSVALFDSESKLDIAAGRHIVATGSLALSGEVIEVGGIRQKAIAAQRDGADVFLVPAENQRAATRAVLEICSKNCVEVQGVSSVRDALEYLLGTA